MYRKSSRVCSPPLWFSLQLVLEVFLCFFSLFFFSFFTSASPTCARLFCKCVGVQGLLEKYAGSSVFLLFFFQLSYLFIYFTKRNAPHRDQYIKRPKGTNPKPCSQLFPITYILKHTHSTPHSPPFPNGLYML